jgi:hypothetical protein
MARRPSTIEEKGNAVLTNGLRGPGGEGVGEVVRDAATRKEATLVGEAERRRGVKVRGFSASRASTGGLRLTRRRRRRSLDPLLLHFSPPPSSLSPVRDGVNGDETLWRLGLGARGVMAAATYRRGAVGGMWTTGMQRWGARSHRDGGHDRRGRSLARVSAIAVKEGCDDDDITLK